MPIFRTLNAYATEARRARALGLSVGTPGLVRYFRAWKSSLRNGASPLKDRRPWLTFGAIDFLAAYLKPHMTVCEFGSGGSSIFFARRVKTVIVVEHDPAWALRVQETLVAEGLTNCRLLAIEPQPDDLPGEPSDAHAYVSSGAVYRGSSFRSYASVPDGFADGFFDVIVVDGRARPACARHSLSKVAIGGCIVLDNAERPHYRSIHQMLAGKNWEKHDFSGPGPYIPNFWQTCIWRKLA